MVTQDIVVVTPMVQNM